MPIQGKLLNGYNPILWNSIDSHKLFTLSSRLREERGKLGFSLFKAYFYSIKRVGNNGVV